MQAIRIGVVRGRAYCSTDGWRVYGDGGTGTIDWAHPVTPRRQLFWNDAPVVAGHLLAGHFMGTHLDGVRPDGHVLGTHLADEHLFPAAAVFWDTEPFVFGRFQHAVVTEDAAGNVAGQGAAVYEQVVNGAPPTAYDLAPAVYAQGRLTFTFTPSERLVG